MADPRHSPPTAEDNRQGIFATLAAMTMFILNDSLVKLAGADYPPGQLMVVRGVFASLFMLAFVAFSGARGSIGDAFRPRVLVRGVLEALSAMTFVTALTRMPIADVTAILQASPILITVFCAALGLERVGPGRWAAVLVGFVGVLLIVKPGSGSFRTDALLALLCAAIVAARDIYTRTIPAGIPNSAVALTTAVTVVFGGAALGFSDWTPLRTEPTLKLFFAAIFVALGNVMIVAAYRRAEASVVSPFRYSVVIFAGAIGFVVFGEVPDLQAVAGTILIVASGLYTLRSERARRQESADT
jgi:drug/metabolite transporter (DMT)-like permease